MSAFLVAGGLLSIAVGQTCGWDLLNYHLYNAWSFLHHRGSRDVFVANEQSYFDPLIGLPYYLVATVWLPEHPRWVAFLAGLPYGALCYLALWISRKMIGGLGVLGALERRLSIFIATVLASSSVFAWSQLGTDTGELPVAVLVLAGVAVLLHATAQRVDRRLRNRDALVIGLLLGAAAGLKLTAAVYVPAMELVLLFSAGNLRAAVRIGLLYAFGAVLAFGLFYGFWGWHLYRETGNPFFPMFNNVFHSPYAAAKSGRDTRFQPHGLVEWVLLPFVWIFNRRRLTNGVMFHEARLAMFFCLVLLSGAVAMYRRRWWLHATGSASLMRVVSFCVASYLIWLAVFALARYIVVIVMLGSIASVTMLVLLSRTLRVTYAPAWRIAVIGGLACVVGVLSQPPRTRRVPYAGKTYKATVPDLEPDAMVVLGNNPMGLTAMLLGRDNAGVRFVGLPVCFARHGRCYRQFFHFGLGRKVRSAIQTHHGPLYVAFYAWRNPSMPQLAQFGVQPDLTQCRLIRTHATRDVKLCRATRGGGNAVATSYRLTVNLTKAHAATDVSTHWVDNACGAGTRPGRLFLRWSVHHAKPPIKVLVQGGKGHKRLFAGSSSRSGHARTGTWVRAKQRFIIVDARGQRLAMASITYTPCDN